LYFDYAQFQCANKCAIFAVLWEVRRKVRTYRGKLRSLGRSAQFHLDSSYQNGSPLAPASADNEFQSSPFALQATSKLLGWQITIVSIHG